MGLAHKKMGYYQMIHFFRDLMQNRYLERCDGNEIL